MCFGTCVLSKWSHGTEGFYETKSTRSHEQHISRSPNNTTIYLLSSPYPLPLCNSCFSADLDKLDVLLRDAFENGEYAMGSITHDCNKIPKSHYCLFSLLHIQIKLTRFSCRTLNILYHQGKNKNIKTVLS